MSVHPCPSHISDYQVFLLNQSWYGLASAAVYVRVYIYIIAIASIYKNKKYKKLQNKTIVCKFGLNSRILYYLSHIALGEKQTGKSSVLLSLKINQGMGVRVTLPIFQCALKKHYLLYTIYLQIVTNLNYNFLGRAEV